MRGYVTSRITTEGGIDESTGLPIPEVTDWTEQVECQYYPNRKSTVGSILEGKFRLASYEITIHTTDWRLDEVSLIRLIDQKGKVISESEVLTLDNLEDIQRIKITI